MTADRAVDGVLAGSLCEEGAVSLEGRGIEPIPESARYGSLARVVTVWFTPNLALSAFFIWSFATADFLRLGFAAALLELCAIERIAPTDVRVVLDGRLDG